MFRDPEPSRNAEELRPTRRREPAFAGHNGRRLLAEGDERGGIDVSRFGQQRHNYDLPFSRVASSVNRSRQAADFMSGNSTRNCARDASAAAGSVFSKQAN